jgi:hypothetical protein
MLTPMSLHATLAHRGHGIPNKRFVNIGRGLDVGRNHNCVFPQVELEGIARPVSLGLHNIEGHPSEEVL